MLSDHVVYATIPTQDVERLRRFYEDVLGFRVLEETLSGIFYRGAAGTMFAVTRSGGKASGRRSSPRRTVTPGVSPSRRRAKRCKRRRRRA
jgi:catechol 2,3-dioxygenase-like lactoylglutathione lyase family enzyme